MSIIVLLEEVPTKRESFGENSYEAKVRAVHGAPADPDIGGDPGELTFCGQPTAGMTKDDYQAAWPGATWYPPKWHALVCRGCDRRLKNS